MATSPLVPNISPLVDALRRFTPQAREDREIQLAGLGQQSQLRDLQLQAAQRAQRQAQITDVANTNRAALIEEQSDIDFVLKDGVDGLRNNIALLAAKKGDDSPDLPELIQFANQATTDPEGAFAQLEQNQGLVNKQISTIDDILGRTKSPINLAKGARLIDPRTKEVLVGPAAGAELSDLPAEAIAFRDLIKDFTPKQQKLAKLVKAGLKGRAMSNAVLSAIESGDITKLADAKAQIKQAEKFAELTGSSRAKAIDKGFESIFQIDQGIKNIDNAIAVLDKGAGVGAVEKIWPSIKAASVELDNIRGRMALDVIGSVTFGALSKGELDLAKDIALPTGLDTEELKDYLNRKKVAQIKLRDYYNEQIQFLDQGGTVAGFLRKKEGEQSSAGPAVAPAQPKFLGFE